MPTKNIKGIRISIILKIPTTFKTFMHVEKWKKIFQKSCGVRFQVFLFLKYVWPFFNIKHEKN